MIPNTIGLVIPGADTTMRLGRVEQIKAIRTLTGLGLKEAKDISDAPGKHFVKVLGVFDMFNDRTGTSNPQANYEAVLRSLRATGVTVIDKSREYSESLDRLAGLASSVLLCRQYDLAQDLLAVLQKYDA